MWRNAYLSLETVWKDNHRPAEIAPNTEVLTPACVPGCSEIRSTRAVAQWAFLWTLFPHENINHVFRLRKLGLALLFACWKCQRLLFWWQMQLCSCVIVWWDCGKTHGAGRYLAGIPTHLRSHQTVSLEVSDCQLRHCFCSQIYERTLLFMEVLVCPPTVRSLA